MSSLIAVQESFCSEFKTVGTTRTAPAWSWVPEQVSSRLPIHVTRLDEVNISRQDYWQIEPSSGFQFIYVQTGTVSLDQHGHSLFIESGSCAIVTQGAISTHEQGTASFTAVTLHGVMADHLISGWPKITTLQNSKAIERSLLFMRRTLQRQETNTAMYTAERLSAQAYRLLLHLSLHEQDLSVDNPRNPTVAAAMGILQSCPARDLDVQRIANAVGVSVSHLHRLFKRVLNTTPLHYAHQHIITRAREALVATDKSCSDISKQLGYDDPLYFSAVFKRYAGESPRAYRQRMQKL